MSPRCTALPAAIVLLSSLAGTAIAQPTTYTAVAVQPEFAGPVPNALRPNQTAFPGSNFDWTNGTTPSIDVDGQVHFFGPINNPPTIPVGSGPSAIWHWNGTLNNNVALYGTTTIGGQALTSSPGVVYGDSGNGTAWRATLGGQTAYVTNTTGSLGVIAQNTQPSIYPSAGTGTINWSSISNTAETSSSGAVMFTASLANSAGATGTGLVTTAGLTRNDSGLFIGTPGNVVAVGRAGTVLGSETVTIGGNPVTGSYALGAINTGGRWAVNGTNNVIFQSALQGTTILTTNTPTTLAAGAVGTRNDQVMMLATPSGGSYSLTTIARGGTAAPGAPAGVLFDQLGNIPGINNAGQYAFIASLRNTAIGNGDVINVSGNAGQNSTALFSNNGGSLTMLARQGQPISLGSTVNFGLMSGNAVVNSGGVVSMVTSLGGTAPNGTSGLFTFAGGITSELIRTGIALPSGLGSIPAGASLASFQGGFASNAMNAYVFYGLLKQSAALGINNTNYGVLMAVMPNGQLRLLARTGDAWDAVNGGPMTGSTVDGRIITGINFQSGSGTQDGRASGLNDAGTVAFGLTFTDAGTQTYGIYTATVVPTPGVAGLLGLAGLGFAGRRRR